MKGSPTTLGRNSVLFGLEVEQESTSPHWVVWVVWVVSTLPH